MIKLKLVLLISSLLLFTGCYNYRELDDLDIVTAVSLDKTNTNFLLTAQIINTQKPSNNESSSNKFYTFKAEGKTVQEAFRNIINTSPRRIYFNHNQLLVLSETISKEGLGNIIDLFIRDNESRKDYSVIIARNTPAHKIIETITKIDQVNAFNIKSSLNSNKEHLGIINNTTLSQTINDYLDPNKEPSIPSISLVGDKEDNSSNKQLENTTSGAHLQVETMSIFKNNKLSRYLNKDESLSLNILNNNVLNIVLTYPCNKNKYISLEISNIKTSLSYKNNNIIISIKGDMNLCETTCSYDLLNKNTLSSIEKNTENYAKSIISKTLNTLINDNDLLVTNIPSFLYKNKIKNYQDIKFKVHFEFISVGSSLKDVSWKTK